MKELKESLLGCAIGILLNIPVAFVVPLITTNLALVAALGFVVGIANYFVGVGIVRKLRLVK